VALPTAYLTSTKNLEGILMAVQNAQAPAKFTQAFLESLGYASSSDRLVINMLKALGFLSAAGEPTERYIRYLEPAESGRVLAEGIRDAYADLFRVNIKAQEMPRAELKGKIRVLTQGKLTDGVVDKMAMTFSALSQKADWAATPASPPPPPPDGGNDRDGQDVGESGEDDSGTDRAGLSLGGLVYNIQIQLPESRDQAVYDALFKSLKAHLIQ
jgi:hypothetical protein